MENSGKILGGDDTPQWYVASGDRWIGPLSASEIYEKIQSNQITWAHFVWRKGQPDWKRICELKAFQASVPNPPARDFQREIQRESKETPSKSSTEPEIRPAAGRRAPVATAAKTAGPPIAPEVRNWYLYYSDSQYGPFSQEEISRFIKVGKIHLRVFGWREGMKNWERLGQIEAFASHKGVDQTMPRREQRGNPRRPLVAKILMSDDKTVIMGICRDISIGGLQVLIERLPGEVGTRLKMNISPSSNESGARIEPFVAEGVIVRILEDGRGFSFRFERLSDRAIRSIEAYFESPQ